MISSFQDGVRWSRARRYAYALTVYFIARAFPSAVIIPSLFCGTSYALALMTPYASSSNHLEPRERPGSRCRVFR